MTKLRPEAHVHCKCKCDESTKDALIDLYRRIDDLEEYVEKYVEYMSEAVPMMVVRDFTSWRLHRDTELRNTSDDS